MDSVHRKLLALVALLAVGSAVGVVLLWPTAPPAPQAPPEPLVDAVVRSAMQIDCPEENFVPVRPPCLLAEVEIVEGPDRGLRFDVDTGETGAPPFAVGDRLKAYGSPGPDGVFYSVADYDRLSTMGWLVGLFVVAVLTAGRWHGLRSLVGLGISLLIITIFVVPAILAGSNPLAVAIVGAFTIMLVTLYLSHGLNVKTTTALVGTAGALVLTGVLGVVFAQVSRPRRGPAARAPVPRSARWRRCRPGRCGRASARSRRSRGGAHAAAPRSGLDVAPRAISAF